MPLLTFDDAYDSLPENESPSILLGNGFSQAWQHRIFNYGNLLQNAVFLRNNDKIHNLFSEFQTFDFEKIMRALEDTEKVLSIYNINPIHIQDIHNDQGTLKDSLIQVISNTHPLRSSQVTTQQFTTAKTFLKHFKNLFTVNYDLLLYWVANKNDIAPLGYFSDDGFRRTRWENEDEQNLFYLHGGLHIYDTGEGIMKHVFNGDADISIIDQVQDNLNQGLFPLFVSEPTHQKKLERIEHNPYLLACYKALRTINGPLFIHGHSMDENDKHIFEQIKLSRVNRIFVSIFGDESSEMNLVTIANARRFLGQNITFYDAATARIW